MTCISQQGCTATALTVFSRTCCRKLLEHGPHQPFILLGAAGRAAACRCGRESDLSRRILPRGTRWPTVGPRNPVAHQDRVFAPRAHINYCSPCAGDKKAPQGRCHPSRSRAVTLGDARRPVRCSVPSEGSQRWTERAVHLFASPPRLQHL